MLVQTAFCCLQDGFFFSHSWIKLLLEYLQNKLIACPYNKLIKFSILLECSVQLIEDISAYNQISVSFMQNEFFLIIYRIWSVKVTNNIYCLNTHKQLAILILVFSFFWLCCVHSMQDLSSLTRIKPAPCSGSRVPTTGPQSPLLSHFRV